MRMWITATVLCLMTAAVPAQSSEEFYSESRQLDACVRQALRNNPDLQSSLARYRSSLQKIPQISALPDPTFAFSQFVRSVETRVASGEDLHSQSEVPLVR